MRIRLEGTEGECEVAVALLQQAGIFHIVQISAPYANRPPSQLVRRYLEVRIPGSGEQPPAGPPSPPPQRPRLRELPGGRHRLPPL